MQRKNVQVNGQQNLVLIFIHVVLLDRQVFLNLAQPKIRNPADF